MIEARFLIPAYALLSVTVASLLPDLRFNPLTPVPALSLTAALAGLTVFGIWQLGVVNPIGRQQELGRDASRSLALVLQRESKGQPCHFASEFAFPVIAFASGCQGSHYDPARPFVYVHDDPGKAPLYVLTASDPRTQLVQPVPGTARRLRDEGGRGWSIFVAPASRIVVVR